MNEISEIEISYPYLGYILYISLFGPIHLWRIVIRNLFTYVNQLQAEINKNVVI